MQSVFLVLQNDFFFEKFLHILGALRVNFSEFPECTEGQVEIKNKPVKPEYDRLKSRLKTFEKFPGPYHHTPKEYADVGFYYEGPGDLVRCFSCGGCLSNWKPEQNPASEHSK